MTTQGRSSDRQMPHNLEAEQGLIGAVIIRNDLLFEAMRVVSPEDFYEPANGELWKVLLDLIPAGKFVTKNTLLQDVAQESDMGGMRTREYIQFLVDNAPPSFMARDMARVVHDNAEKRGMAEAFLHMAEEVFACPPSMAASELRAEADAAFTALYKQPGDMGIQHISEVGDEVLGAIEKALQSGVAGGVQAGLVAVEDLIGKLFPGDLVTLGGAPGSGKTSLAQQIAENASEDGTKKALFYSIEMRREQLAARVLSAASGTPLKKIREGAGVDREQHEAMVEENARRRKSGFYIASAIYPTVAMIRATATRMKRTKGLDFLVIDHLHYIAPPSPKMDEVESVNLNLMALKQLAGDLGIPIIVLVQFSTPSLRDMHKWPHRRPSQGDILFSGMVDRHSDATLMIHRPLYFLMRNEPDKGEKHYADWSLRVVEEKKDLNDEEADSWTQLIVTKNREGGGWGQRKLYFDGKRTKFYDNAPRASRVPVGELALTY